MNHSKFNPNKVDRHGNQYKVVPKYLRKRVYQKVHEELNKNESALGLCIILPNTLNEINKKYPSFQKSVDSDLIFPEFGEYIKKYNPIQYKDIYRHNEHLWRRTVIEEILNKF